AVLTAALVALLLVATGASSAATAPTPVSGGTVTIAGASAISALDPTISSAVGASDANALIAIYDTILRYNPAKNTYEDVTAKSLTPNADDTVWTLVLKPGIKFSDGTAYNASAVKKSILRHVAPGSTSLARSYVGLIKSMKVLNRLTLQF